MYCTPNRTYMEFQLESKDGKWRITVARNYPMGRKIWTIITLQEEYK